MTTVAWDGKTLASDSRGTDDDDVAYRVPKIWRLPDGSLFGACGEGSITVQVLLWLEGRRGKPELTEEEGDDFAGLLIQAGRIFIFDDHRLEPEEHFPQPVAIGSGAKAAIAYMRDGATAIEAVQKVIKYGLDNATGGPVQSLRYKAHTRSPHQNPDSGY